MDRIRFDISVSKNASGVIHDRVPARGIGRRAAEILDREIFHPAAFDRVAKIRRTDVAPDHFAMAQRDVGRVLQVKAGRRVLIDAAADRPVAAFVVRARPNVVLAAGHARPLAEFNPHVFKQQAVGKLLEKIPGGSDPEQFSLSRDERYAFASNEDDASLAVVSLADRRVVDSIKVGTEPEGVTTSPDGKFIYVTSETSNDVHVFDAKSFTIVGHVKTAQRPRSVAFTPDGKKAFVACESGEAITVIDSVSKTVTGQINMPVKGYRPMGTVVSADGKKLYVTTGRGGAVVVISTATDKITAVVKHVGDRPWGVALSNDGKWLYTANGPSNDITIIEVKSNKIQTHVKAGTSPWGVAVDGGR